MSATENITQVTSLSPDNLSIFALIGSADIISKLVMLTLIITSIWSWTIIINKIFSFRKVKKEINNFETIFWSGGVLDQLYENVKRSITNPLAAVFVSAMNECKRGQHIKTESYRMGHKERILQVMYLVRNRELEKLEQNLGFLAAVGSNALFIGLFGTVWGIIHSFQSIAASKNTSLAVVAPGIAEALLATAIGLLVAVPAVIFFNFLSSQVTTLNNKLDDFIGELNTILSRAMDEEKL